ncbi:LpqN/LpqT family lipoprotein [Gordonia sp. NPDC003424]
MSGLTIYDRVALMAVSQARVIDGRTVAGKVHIDLDASWQEQLTDPEAGLLKTFIAADSMPGCFRDNVVVILTRFIVDATVDVNDLLDDAFAEARALPEWMEQRADRSPISDRTEGSTIQSGSFHDPDAGWLFTVTSYVLYQRANVVYLLQCTGTTASTTATDWSTVIKAVQSCRLDD